MASREVQCGALEWHIAGSRIKIYKKIIELRNEDEKMNENKEHYEVINDDKDVRAPLTSSPNNAAKSSSSLSSSTR